MKTHDTQTTANRSSSTTRKIRTGVKAGALTDNHSKTLATRKIRTGVKAGALTDNHSKTLARRTAR